MSDLGDLAPGVEQRLAELIEEETRRWTDIDPDLGAPLRSLGAYVLGGGKRLRPAFCYWSFRGAGGDADDPGIIDAGAALEMLHAGALIHDDVIDRSRRRRGAPTAHVELADLHRSEKWMGESDAFGEAAAIIVGDLAVAFASRLLDAASPAAVSVFDEMRVEVNMGQYLDTLGAAHGLDGPGLDETERARLICRYKTAKYTVERPMHLGAALAGGDRLSRLGGAISDFALPLGEAFQLRDDLLGAFGDESVTGKPVGDDLRQGKVTLLAGLAAERGSMAEREFFAARFGAADLDDAEVRALQELMTANGARAEVEAAVARLLASAEAALDALPMQEEAVSALRRLSALATGRDH